MHGHRRRFQMMTLVMLVALMGCGKGVRLQKMGRHGRNISCYFWGIVYSTSGRPSGW